MKTGVEKLLFFQNLEDVARIFIFSISVKDEGLAKNRCFWLFCSIE